jgi:prepilin-type N-terminal cleavage/methylation domain-containing protein
VFGFREARRGEGGYTLVELLVAMTVLAIVFLPLSALLAAGGSGMVQAGRRTAAANLCREKMEEIKARGCSYYLDAVDAAPGGIYLEMENLGFFRRETKLQQLELTLEGEDAGVAMLKIDVQVKWQEGAAEQCVELSSYLAGR